MIMQEQHIWSGADKAICDMRSVYACENCLTLPSTQTAEIKCKSAFTIYSVYSWYVF